MSRPRETSGAEAITFSIVTPCYNGARFIRETLASAATQTYAPLEMIVVDDGSTDDSADIVEAFGGPARVIRQRNQGESVARNRGLAEARGSHVLFLDADDLIAPGTLEHVAEALGGRPEGAVALMGCARFTEDPARPISVTPAEFTQFFPGIIETNFGPPHCWVAPVSVMRAAGGFCESLQWSEDWDMLWRVGVYASELIPLSYVGALYRQHATSQFATTSLADRARGHAILLGRMAAAFLDRPELLQAYGSELFWGAWTAVRHARRQGVPWRELQPLLEALQIIAVRGPQRIRKVNLARSIRWVGARTALSLCGL